MERRTLTKADGPVVVGGRTLRALGAIRREKLLGALYGKVVAPASAAAACQAALGWTALPQGVETVADAAEGEVALPSRIAAMEPRDPEGEAAVRLALKLGARLVLLDGPIKERAKLSFIKCEGTLSILVSAHRAGHLSHVRPMVNALKALGHGDVLPDETQLAALWRALEQLEDEG